MPDTPLSIAIRELPGRIKDQTILVARLVKEVEAIKLRNDMISSPVRYSVLMDVNFKNDGMRTTEINKRLQLIPEFQSNLLALNDLDAKISVQKIELEYLHNLLKAYIAVVPLEVK